MKYHDYLTLAVRFLPLHRLVQGLLVDLVKLCVKQRVEAVKPCGLDIALS